METRITSISGGIVTIRTKVVNGSIGRIYRSQAVYRGVNRFPNRTPKLRSIEIIIGSNHRTQPTFGNLYAKFDTMGGGWTDTVRHSRFPIPAVDGFTPDLSPAYASRSSRRRRRSVHESSFPILQKSLSYGSLRGIYRFLEDPSLKESPRTRRSRVSDR